MSPFWERRSARGVQLPRPTGWGTVPRYTYRRLAKLPSTAEDLRRHTVLNLPGMLDGLSLAHMVMEPGAAVPISVEDETALLIFTLSGRGVMLLDGDRIEVSANDLVHIPAGVPYGMHTLGGTDWVYVVLQAPSQPTAH
ncbi:MAG TPA: cupin domain-containing protein [Gemmatimonadales bacterium]|nr:cupin domain-containing protein [Gemmatimonadales bacterium]